MKKVKYTYTSSIDFINNLEFDYIETYSLLRGEDYENKHKLASNDFNFLSEKESSNTNLTSKEAKRLLETREFLITQYLINEKGQFHPSSKKTNTFNKDALIVEKLKNILRTEIKELPRLLCAPEYREAIVFYNKNKQIVSTLNVCLSCNIMEAEKFSHINADWETYDLLKRFFIEIGHEVEDPNTFMWEDLQNEHLRLKAKQKKWKTE